MVSNALEKSMKTAPVALPPSTSFRIRFVKKDTADSVKRLGRKLNWCSERKPLNSRC